ncbi:hypothetical protein BDR22DRAFT_521026 [Usnea florida]
MSLDKMSEYGNKLAELATQEVTTPLPAENAIHARLSGIDGTGNAVLVSKVEQGAKKYEGFALVFKHDTDSQRFEWLQFITRQLVVNHTAQTGSLIVKSKSVAYQLLDSADEITDYALATGSQPANWSTCWKVDSAVLGKALFRDSFEFVRNVDKKVSAILDLPGPTVGKVVAQNSRYEYIDLPGDMVNMKSLLESQNGDGISRAYFS